MASRVIRIVSWNMQHWSRKPAERTAAWDYLKTTLKPDFALLQETAPPNDISKDHVVFHPIDPGKPNPWGTAVVSFSDPLSKVESVTSKGQVLVVDRSHPGCLVAAQAGCGLALVSAYGRMEGAYAITTVHRLLSDLTPLIDTRAGMGMVVAGDLNVSTQFREPDRERHRELFRRFASLGLEDCFALDLPPRRPLERCPCADLPCRHVQTHRHNRSPLPWHLDYAFVSKRLRGKVRSCGVQAPNPWDLSDHSPVVLELVLNVARA